MTKRLMASSKKNKKNSIQNNNNKTEKVVKKDETESKKKAEDTVKKENKEVKVQNENSKVKKTSKAKSQNSKKSEATVKENQKNIVQNENQKDKSSKVKNQELKKSKEITKKNKTRDNEEKSKKTSKTINKTEKEKEEKEDTKELVVENVSLKELTGKPDYVEELIRKRKMKIAISIIIILLILFIIFFSIIFSLLNMNKNTIINGVKIKNIDVSELSIDEARTKVTDSLNKELVTDLVLKYNDYKTIINPSQIEFTYNVEDSLNVAYDIGRTDNIVKNNYSILSTNIKGKNLDISYSYNQDLLNTYLDNINSELPGVVVEPTYYIENNKLYVEKGKDGIQISNDSMQKLILSCFVERNIENIVDDSYKQEANIVVENKKSDKINMEEIYKEVYTEPKDAYFETEPYKIYKETDGIDLNVSVEEAQKQIDAEDKEEYIFDLKISKANKTIDDLGTEAFPYLISAFSTKYDASNVNRSTNLQIAAEKINGKVLMPGEEFSFNTVVGKRTVEDGYRDAKIYADGGVVDGLAGGICQISSTLYNSVVLANLEIIERKNHSYPTSYVQVGRDATVVYGIKDFKFKNSRSYPIKIEASVKNGIAEFKIHGMQEETEYEVRLLPVTTSSIPYSTTYQEDPTLAPGTQAVLQTGHPGYKVTTYKELRLNGVVVSKEVFTNDTYEPMRTIIRVRPTQ